ncbi:MAG: hypothetical protein WCL02_01115 [bacterium]
MKNLKKTIVISSKLDMCSIFSCEIHTVDTIQELNLDPEKFYKTWRKNHDLPLFPHHEVELFQTEKFKQYLSINTIFKPHITKSSLDKEFMCYLRDITSPEDAYIIWKAWCVGTMYSIIEFTKGNPNYDFAPLFGSSVAQHQEFIDMMSSNEGIQIIEE